VIPKVCSNLAPNLSRFSSFSTCILAGFFSRSDPEKPTVSGSLQITVGLELQFLEIMATFSSAFSSEITFDYQFVQKEELYNSRLGHTNTLQSEVLNMTLDPVALLCECL
jgi:hypothetical protein